MALIDGDPRRQPEEAAHFGVLIDGCAVIDELPAAQRKGHALIHEARRVGGRLQVGGTHIMWIVAVMVRPAA
jgi:hypothetical protein